MDFGVVRMCLLCLFCEPCWRGRVYAYMEPRKATQSAADGLTEHAIGRTQNPDALEILRTYPFVLVSTCKFPVK